VNPNEPAKASRFVRKMKSLQKRTLLGFVNSSDAYHMQEIPDFVYYDVPTYRRLREFWADDGSRNNAGDCTRLLAILLNVKSLLEEGIEGSFAELGVWRGNSAKVLRELTPDRKFFLFDTFEGFPEQDAKVDPAAPSASGFSDTSLERVKKFVGESANTFYCVGYFPQTADHVPKDEKFAFVHLDCDLEAPIKAGLEFFYPRLSAGGTILIHDYESGGKWPGVKRAVDEFLKDKPERLILLPDKSGSAIFRKLR